MGKKGKEANILAKKKKIKAIILRIRGLRK